jgi:hypothetical protein
MSDITSNMDQVEQVARIERMQEETRKFFAETRKIDKDRSLAAWQIVITAMTAGAALFGAGAAFIKILG